MLEHYNKQREKWHKWKEGNPIPRGDMKVCVKFRSNRPPLKAHLVGFPKEFNWNQYGGPGDIIAYRIAVYGE